MGTLVTCCRNCSCPKPGDTAISRRQILNENSEYLANHASFLESSKVRVRTEYVEKPSGELSFTKLFEPKDPHQAKGMICYSH